MSCSGILTKGHHLSQLCQRPHQLGSSRSNPWLCCRVLCLKCWKREKSWCDGLCMSRVVVSECDVFQSELAPRSQRLQMHPSAPPMSFNGPINWNWGYLSKSKSSFSHRLFFTWCIKTNVHAQPQKEIHLKFQRGIPIQFRETSKENSHRDNQCSRQHQTLAYPLSFISSSLLTTFQTHAFWMHSLLSNFSYFYYT